MITLTNETIFLLKTLYTQIDIEMGKPCNETNIDVVTENQYKILGTVKKIVFNENR